MTDDKRNTPPPAQGIRQQWDDMPQKIRDRVEAQLGSTVIRAETQSGGFSPGVAARLYTADGQTVFLKAIGTDINPTSILFHRKEAKINALFPENSFAPDMLWWHDDEADTGWIALLFENIDGYNPPTPWRDDELRQVMTALSDLSTTLTPSPVGADLVASASDYFATRIHGWQHIKADYESYVERLDEWSKHHLDALCELEQVAPAAVAGNTLVHFDIRADNIVINDEGAWFVDWPHACIGAAWLDTIAFAPSVAMQGGLQPQDLLQLHPASRDADPDLLTAAVVSIAGMFTLRGFQPPPSGLPTLREFQAALGEVTRRWIAQRTGWQ